jgi:hypothetical protein
MTSLAEYEKSAPSIEIELEKEVEEPEKLPKTVRTVHIEENTRRISKLSLSAALLSSAALIVMFISIYFREVPVPVGTLTDAVNATWSDSEVLMVGDSLENVISRDLLTGFVEITFDNGAKTVIEGPAKFTCESPESIYVETGKVYAKIDNASAGFILNTPYAKMVDLGTEFGADITDEQSELHVYKGKVKLFSQNSKAKNRRSEDITANQARRVNSYDNMIETISFSHSRFKKQVPSEYELAVLVEQPAYYWRFDYDESSVLVNLADESSNAKCYRGKPRFDQGPVLRNGCTNKALRASNRS